MYSVAFHEGRRVVCAEVPSLMSSTLHSAARDALQLQPTDRLRLIWCGKNIAEGCDDEVVVVAPYRGIALYAVVGRDTLDPTGGFSLLFPPVLASVGFRDFAFRCLDTIWDFMRTMLDTRYDRLPPPSSG